MLAPWRDSRYFLQVTATMNPFEEVAANAELHSIMKDLNTRIQNGSGKAAFELALLYGSDYRALSLDTEIQPLPADEEKEIENLIKAFNLLLVEAQSGIGESMYLVSLYYQLGWPPVEYDEAHFVDWSEKAFTAGYLFAANNLYSTYSEKLSGFHNPSRAAEMLRILKKNDLLVVSESPYEIRWEDEIVQQKSNIYKKDGTQ